MNEWISNLIKPNYSQRCLSLIQWNKLHLTNYGLNLYIGNLQNNTNNIYNVEELIVNIYL